MHDITGTGGALQSQHDAELFKKLLGLLKIIDS